MGRFANTCRGCGREDGFALAELLVGAMLCLALIGSAITVFTTGLRSEPRAAERTSDIASARTFAESLSRELRQGWEVPTASSGQISIITYVKRATCGGTAAGTAIPCRVTYTCASGECSRVVANPDGTGAGSPVKVVDGLADANVFTYSPSAAAPEFVGIRLSFAASATEDSITLEDGVTLRNEVPEA
jgi:Tfp pilus assembly protein PilW